MHLGHPRFGHFFRFTPTRVGNALHDPDSARGPKVHPHAGGECVYDELIGRGYAGSPPRGWGMPARARPKLTPSRFTPTRVGNADSHCGSARPGQVHPHAGGECEETISLCLSSPGSPPRGWGMHTSEAACIATGRFTPTRVGNAFTKKSMRPTSPLHPHAGGECLANSTEPSLPVGSPPRGWGMLYEQQRQQRQHGFTPTRVGNALYGGRRPRSLPVHPHAGGECAPGCDRDSGERGSPPRGWGMPLALALRALNSRFTPTRVGNAAIPANSGSKTPVHPHAGGECVLKMTETVMRYGSPPRGWGMRRGQLPAAQPGLVHPHAGGECLFRGYDFGRPAGSPPRGWGMPTIIERHAMFKRVHPHAGGECSQPCRLCAGWLWFTPTRVGNAKIARRRRISPPVHPHAGGECIGWDSNSVPGSGSPPRGWGMHHELCDRGSGGRFTPTRVGNACNRLCWFCGLKVHPHAGGECELADC